LKQSKNHVMMGSIDAWFYKYLTGIKPDENNPAYSVFTIKPFVPEGLNKAEAKIETIRGTICSGWRKEQDKFILEVEVPFNTSALISIPAGENDAVSDGSVPIVEADNVQYIGYMEGHHQLKVPSGKYKFQVIKGMPLIR
jgi:alpha-L-rhamnosidase